MNFNGSDMNDGTTGCCGPATGRFNKNFTMDTPMPHNPGAENSMRMARMIGHAVNNKKLAGMSATNNTSVVMTRANNLASLTAALLLQVKPEQRRRVLDEIGGFNFSQHILNFTEANPAKFDVTDALRFSLALNFMLGIIDHEAGKSTMLCTGYRKFARLFKDAQDRRAGRPEGTTAQSTGLSGFGVVLPAYTPKAVSTRTLTVAPAAPATVARYVPVKVFTPSVPTEMEKAGYIPPATATTDWNTVGTQKTAAPAQNIKSRDSSGRCIQWSPKDPCYPQPTDIALDLSVFQADACGRTADQLVPTIDQKRQAKYDAIKRKFAEVFGRPPNNAEATVYGMMQWCASDWGTFPGESAPRRWGDPMTAMTQRMVRVREDIERGSILVHPFGPYEGGQIKADDFAFRDAGSDIARSIKQAADTAFMFLGKVATAIGDILCAGFKALFGPAIGDVICQIVRFFINMMVGGIAAIVKIVVASLEGTFNFIKLMVEGKVEDAFTALLKSMGKIIFALAAPLMVPILMANNRGPQTGTRPNGSPIYAVVEGPTLAEAMAELDVRAERVMKKEPLWPIMVVMAVVGVFSAISGNVLGAITGLIIALAPMVATFISAPLKAEVTQLMGESLETIEAGIGKFIKFVLLIFNGAMAIKDIVPKLRGQLEAFFKKGSTNAGSLTGDVKNKDGSVTKANPAQRIKYVIEKFMKGVDAVTAAFKNFNCNDIMKSAGPLLMLIPDVLLAILPEDAAEAMPSLTEWKDAVKKSSKSVEDEEATLKKATLTIFDTFTLGTQKKIIAEQAASWRGQRVDEYGAKLPATPMPVFTPAEAAAMVAPQFGQQFKNKSTYPQFITALKTELLKV